MILDDLASGQAAAVNWPRVVQTAASAVTHQAAAILRRRQPTPDEAEEMVATTLVTGYLLPASDGLSGAMIQVGDSGAWIQQQGCYQALLDVKTTDYLISSAVCPLPRLPDVTDPVTMTLSAGAVLLVGTDGFGDPLGDGDRDGPAVRRVPASSAATTGIRPPARLLPRDLRRRPHPGSHLAADSRARIAAMTAPVPRIDISSLGIGADLGNGGQGRVTAVSGLLVGGKPAALKAYSQAVVNALDADVLETIVGFPRQLSPQDSGWRRGRLPGPGHRRHLGHLRRRCSYAAAGVMAMPVSVSGEWCTQAPW
jgi:hypothetical protein